jgi:FxsC-like protein
VAHFFFSYSRADGRDQHLYKFFDDLCLELSLRGRIPVESAGFIDKNQPVGAEWNQTMSRALGTCNVLVPVYSPNFFASSYCGKEWHSFATRLEAHREVTGESLDCVVPVWWLPPIGDLPPRVGPRHDPRALFGADHEKHGLRYLRQLNSNRDSYHEAVVQLAIMIRDAGNRPPKPRNDLDVANGTDAFAVESLPAGQPRQPPSQKVTSIRRVTFVVVAGTRDQMQVVRTTHDMYGEWDEWRPYRPACEDPILVRAQGVAYQRGMVSQPHPADDRLFEILETAQARRELAVLILDPWAVKLPNYEVLLRELNRRRFGTTAIVVPWDFAEVMEAHIRDALHLRLDNWVFSGESLFRDGIRSIEEFEKTLVQILVEICGRIIRRAEVARRVAEVGPVSRPILTGPGG